MKNPPTALRLRRLALGLRIRDLAERTGLSDSRISEMERRSGRPPGPAELGLLEAELKDEERTMSGFIAPMTKEEIGLS